MYIVKKRNVIVVHDKKFTYHFILNSKKSDNGFTHGFLHGIIDYKNKIFYTTKENHFYNNDIIRRMYTVVEYNKMRLLDLYNKGLK